MKKSCKKPRGHINEQYILPKRKVNVIINKKLKTVKKDFKLNKLIKEGINCIVVRTLAKKSKKLFIIKKHNVNKTNNIEETNVFKSFSILNRYFFYF